MKIFIFILLNFFICNAMAAPDDELVIIGKIVNMREGPSTDYPILLKLEKGRKLYEIQRQGDWVEVDTGRTDIPSGWVYSTLMLRVTETDSPLLAEKGSHKFESVFDLFKLALSELNERLEKHLGYAPFTDARELGQGEIEVTVKDDWLLLHRLEREAQLSEVFNIWAAAVGEGRAITIYIVDKDGDRTMSMLR